MELKALSNNWKKLQETLKKESSGTKRKSSEQGTGHHRNGVKRRKAEITINKDLDPVGKPLRSKRMTEVVKVETRSEGGPVLSTRRNSVASSRTAQPREGQVNEGLSTSAEIGKYVAIDCEMVGVGPTPDKDSALARVSIVNWNGDQIYDSFVRPKEKVTDWRTFVSGISPKDMTDARLLEEVQRDVSQILDGTILVGHAVRNDLNALLLSHPKRDIRDTSKHPPYRKIAGGGSPRLKVLASELLGLKIQEGAHSSVEDARATMLLFRRDKDGFDRDHAKKWPLRVVPVTAEGDEVGDKPAKKKKKNKKKGRKR